MMIWVIAAASSVTSVSELRVNAIDSAWRLCVEQRVTAIQASVTDGTTLPAKDAADAAMGFCAEFERDYLSAMHAYGPELFAKQGVKSVAPDAVNLLAEETLKLAVKDVRDDTIKKLEAK